MLTKKKNEIALLSQETDILVYVESWLKPEMNFNLSAFNIIKKDRKVDRGSGIIIFIAKDLKYKVADALIAGDPGVKTYCFMITNVSRKFIIVACYRPPENRLKVDKWDIFHKKEWPLFASR